MDVSTLPFNQLIGLKLVEEGDEFQTKLPSGQQYTNHLGTVHASALLAVAEAGSGAFLAKQFEKYTGMVPVVRRIEAKFRKPAVGEVLAKCMVSEETLDNWKNELDHRGRLVAALPMEVVDETNNIVMSATVEWFISKAID